MPACSAPTPSTMSETDNVMQLVKTMKNRTPTVQEKDELMMSLTSLFDDDFNAPFDSVDSFMLTVEDILEGRELSREQDIEALCDKLNESSANFGGETSRLFESFADLFENTERSCSASECRKLKARVDRIARMKRKMAQSEKYKPDFAGFPQNPHSGLAEKAGEDDLMAIRRRMKLSKKMLCGPLQEWKEEQLKPDDVEKRVRDKEYSEQMSGIASTAQDRSKRSQSKSRSECRASSRGRSRSGSRGRSRSQSLGSSIPTAAAAAAGPSVEHSRSRPRTQNETDSTPASPRKASTRGNHPANENAETEHVVNTRRRGRSLSRREQDNTTEVSPTERGTQLVDATTEHVSNTRRRGRSLPKRETDNTEVLSPRRVDQQAMGGTEAVVASPRRRSRSGSRRRGRTNSTEESPPAHRGRQQAMAENTEHLTSPRRRSVSRQEKEKTDAPAARSKSVSKPAEPSCSKFSRSRESGEFAVISKGSTKEIRDKVRSCSLSRSRQSPGGRSSNEPAFLSPRESRRERVAIEPNVSLFSPKTPTRKLEAKLDRFKLKLSAPMLDHITPGSPGSPSSSAENSIRANQTWDPSMGRSPAAGLESDLICGSHGAVVESPRRRQQPAVRRPRLVGRDSGESVREARRRRRESKTEERLILDLSNDI